MNLPRSLTVFRPVSEPLCTLPPYSLMNTHELPPCPKNLITHDLVDPIMSTLGDNAACETHYDVQDNVLDD